MFLLLGVPTSVLQQPSKSDQNTEDPGQRINTVYPLKTSKSAQKCSFFHSQPDNDGQTGKKARRKIPFTHCSSRISSKENKQGLNSGPLTCQSDSFLQFHSVHICVLVNDEGEVEELKACGIPWTPTATSTAVQTDASFVKVGWAIG